jgi:acid stress-induced BolA-like protein IbaG/YrbA
VSQQLSFDEIFPIDVRFDETYSLIDVKVQQVANASTGDAMSLKEIHSLSTESYSIT